jgi:hypothetical protein
MRACYGNTLPKLGTHLQLPSSVRLGRFFQFLRIWHIPVGALQTEVFPLPLISNTSLTQPAAVDGSACLPARRALATPVPA